MDANLISTLVGLSGPTIALVFESYKAMKKTNVEKFFNMLLKENIDLSMIGNNETLQRFFFHITEKVANEVEVEKIAMWKNVIIKISTNYYEFDYKNDFIKVLDSLTVFDLSMLQIIYSNVSKNDFINNQLIEICDSKKIKTEMMYLSLNKLASYNLISTYHKNGSGLLNRNVISFQQFLYKQNSLGVDFLKFCTDYKS